MCSFNQMAKLVQEYQGFSLEDMKFGMAIIRVSFLAGLIWMIMELVIYIRIFIMLKKHNERTLLQNLLPSKDIHQRQEKNVLTLKGQAYVFVLGFIFFLFMFMALSNPWIKFPQGSYSCGLVVISALGTFTRIWASPELRRFYF